jgi:hypothetical protein
MKDGQVNGCGVRMVGLTDPVGPDKSVEGFDVSFNLYAQGFGIVKGGGFTSTQPQIERGSAGKKRRPEAVWIKASGKQATQSRDGKVQTSQDTPEAIFYGTDIRPVLDLLSAVGDGQPIQIGLRFPGAGIDRIYQGVVQMTPEDSSSVGRCMNELLQSIQRPK